jgi:hypothetical protein
MQSAGDIFLGWVKHPLAGMPKSPAQGPKDRASDRIAESKLHGGVRRVLRGFSRSNRSFRFARLAGINVKVIFPTGDNANFCRWTLRSSTGHGEARRALEGCESGPRQQRSNHSPLSSAMTREDTLGLRSNSLGRLRGVKSRRRSYGGDLPSPPSRLTERKFHHCHRSARARSRSMRSTAGPNGLARLVPRKDTCPGRPARLGKSQSNLS